MDNLYLIEQFIKRGFEKTYLAHVQVGFGNPVKFWNKSQYTSEQQFQKYYLNTILVYKNEKYSFKFTKTKDGWRYLSLRDKSKLVHYHGDELHNFQIEANTKTISVNTKNFLILYYKGVE